MVKTPPPIDEELYPPFEGFPKEGIQFLQRLEKNNNREWFGKHKEEYESSVRLPMLSLISDLQPNFRTFAPEYDLNPKRSIFRIYRDVRFSKDKRPYKVHVAAHFVLRGKPKGVSGSGYYLHIEPGEVYIGAGIYMPDGEQMKKIRRAVAERGDDLLSILNNPPFKRMFGGLEGETFARVPSGYPADHPMGDYLKHKHFFVGVSWPDSKCRTKKFVQEAASVFELATPLVRFLNNAIGR